MPQPLPPRRLRSLLLLLWLPLASLPALAACGESASDRPGPEDGGPPDDLDAAPPTDAGPDCGQDTAPEPGLVVTDRGPVRGVLIEEGGGAAAYGYLGIPFAAPPLGALRWRPPEDVACWSTPLLADALPPKCPQLERPDPGGELVPVGDEDCLALNVWAPAEPPDSRLPVLFFIHGGGNTIGSTSQRVDGKLLYDGAPFAAPGDAVVVTTQYRLGPLGFLADDTLSAEDPGSVSGNYGIRDQVAALGWVQRNIAAFGGDPDRVLVFGESAGAVDTCVHLASPGSAGLFAAALMQSGTCNTRETLEAAEVAGDDYVAAAGCSAAEDVPACLRALSTEEALFALPSEVSVVGAGQNRWGPVVDGDLLPEPPVAAMEAGRSHPVPFVVGSNTDETGRDAPAIPDTDEAYRAAIMALGVGRAGADLIMAAYPRETYGSARAAFVQATTDASFTCTARAAARAQASGHPDAPVYRYLFAQRLLGGSPLLRAFGAWHGLELLFLFGQLEVGGYVPTDQDRAVAGELGARWSAFAAAGDPNLGAFDSWPTYREPEERVLVIGGEAPGVARDPRRGRCDFWASLGGGR